MAVKYHRALLKISGEALAGPAGYGVHRPTVEQVARQIGQGLSMGVQIAVVVGGGNIWRGAVAAEEGMERATADYAGMLATIINALALQDALEHAGYDTRTQSALTVPAVAEPYIRRRALRHLEKGRVVIFAAGTGNPFLTTDSAASLRAIEIGAEVLLMAKNQVDGVYSADPRKYPSAIKFAQLSYLDAINQRLGVMDSTALSLCMDNNLPIIVFNLQAERSIERALSGETIGTLVSV